MSGPEKHQSIPIGESSRYSEILNDAKLCSEYRQRLAEAIKKVSEYHGKEKEFQGFMRDLINLEEWLNTVFGFEHDLKFPLDLEEKVANEWHPEGTRGRIGDVLSIAQKKYEEIIRQSLQSNARPESKSDIVTVRLNGIILPPDHKPFPAIGNGNGKPIEAPKFRERLKDLLLTLAENGIYSDDIILISGEVTDSMMRKQSYTIIEIPKLNREILVCDQIGEATFVIYGILGRASLISAGKEDLQSTYGARVMRVIHHNDAQWQSDILQNLLKDADIESLKKIDVKTQEGLRSEILKLKPTPQDWAEMTQKEKQSFKVHDKGLNAIARKFGVEGNPAGYHSIHLELGRKIYGEDHECLKYEEKPDLTPEQIKAEILKLKPTPESWAEMATKEKKSFKIQGKGLIAIARKFGVEGDPISNHLIRLELGRKIYGEEHECLKEFADDEIQAGILKLKPTPESWAEMTQKEKQSFKTQGKGLITIARKFGVEGNPADYHYIHLGLGRKIYGEEHECLQYEEKPDLTSEQIKAEILKLKPTPESWADMTAKEKQSFKVYGKGLAAIARKFGVEGNPAGYHSIHLELGRKIYGEDHECLKYEEKPDLTLEQLMAEILKLKSTPQSWAEMTQKEKQSFKIQGKGLITIARKFGVEGNPIGNHSIHLELGRKIYGEEHECLKSKS